MQDAGGHIGQVKYRTLYTKVPSNPRFPGTRDEWQKDERNTKERDYAVFSPNRTSLPTLPVRALTNVPIDPNHPTPRICIGAGVHCVPIPPTLENASIGAHNVALMNKTRKKGILRFRAAP